MQGDEGATQAPITEHTMRDLCVGIEIISLVALGLASNANAAPIVFSTTLSGPNESPPNASPGIGTALVTFDLAAHTMRVETTFSGLTAGNIASHIHCCTPTPLTGTGGVATTTPTFTGFPGGVTAGSYDNTFDMSLASSYNPAFIAGLFDPTHDVAGAELGRIE